MDKKKLALQYHPDGAFVAGTGVTAADVAKLGPRLAEIRDSIAGEDVRLLEVPQRIPDEKKPLDAAFLEMPENILSDYQEQGDQSELGRILKTASRVREAVDRVVVLGIGGSYMGARALMDACCDPYFNELSRGQRGGRPRMYFEGNNVDNDASQGLLKLLGGGSPAKDLEDKWAVVVISKSGGTLETAVAFRQFLAALDTSCDHDSNRLAQLVVPVTGKQGRLRDLATQLKCPDVFDVPDGVGGRFSILSPVGLVPAAMLGMNVVQLLEGAIAMNEHFRSAPPEQNTVLKYVGACHAMELAGMDIRILSVWAKSLESIGLWYDQLLAESLGKNEIGATPITTVNTRDLHSRAQQHQEGRRDKLVTNLIVDQWRTDPLTVGESKLDQDNLNELSEKSLPELMTAAIEGTNQAYQEDGRPTTDIHLPNTSEYVLGQLLQMLMLATVVEGRLLGVNPYGQPGVEGYKNNMSKILGRGK